MPGDQVEENLRPTQSFEHTLKEISVNRDDPCELVRELVSNAYDAEATLIRLFPLHQSKGLLFFDNGLGLSSTSDLKAGVSPYVSFFSIGKTTKTPGASIGYKCQGSKLCFAAGRFSLITRCQGEKHWRFLTIDNPKNNLNPNYNISPKKTETPWDILSNQILPNADQRTQEVLGQLDKDFFQTSFPQGTLLIVESFEIDDYESRFSTERGHASYLYNYIRFYTAHANIRLIDTGHGFQAKDVKLFDRTRQGKHCSLELWMPKAKSHLHQLENVPPGWPYLSIVEGGTAHKTPEDAPRLRDGTFQARFADTFKYGGQLYHLVLAIDGKRHALSEYSSLDRQGKTQSGVKFADQRGVLLCSQGMRICSCDHIFDLPVLSEKWGELRQGSDHFVLLIDGNFELVTNRNAPAPAAASRLRDNAFLEKIRQFLDKAAKDTKGGPVLTGLLKRLRNEAVEADENKRIEKNELLKKSIPSRDHFCVLVPDCPSVSSKWMISPHSGEEHYVGAIYTLFAHVIPSGHEAAHHWPRPLTFSAIGIDALATTDESTYAKPDKLVCVEYKFRFSTRDGFNHPFSLTDVIVCWDWVIPKVGDPFSDDLHYLATVEELIDFKGNTIGLWLNDIRRKDGGGERPDHRIRVYCLRALLEASFKIKWRRNSP